jgi:hypothetical protein
MSCPICGPICHCDTKTGIEYHAPIVQGQPASRWPHPDAYDATEQQFAASLEQTSKIQGVETQIETLATGLAEPSIFQAYEDPAAWKQELAAKLNEYRSRHKPRPPRYPSLQLKFENTEPAWSNPASQSLPTAYATRESTALNHAEPAPAPGRETPSRAIEPTGRLIEFPRAASVPAAWLDALADPVIERPRILEVPESEFLPPALGGISIEPMPVMEEGKRPGIEIPMLTAPMWRRISAGALDGVVVGLAVALFVYIFVQIAGGMPALRPAIIGGVFLTGIMWAGYQYLLLVYSGTTPGLKLAGLELNGFDGSVVRRCLRRWRVLASVLSGVSLCLGYAWCYLDEDQLCWHDRITKTYMAPKP